MKLPIEAQNEYLFDADGIYISSISGHFSPSQQDAHARQIVRAVNHHDALVAALERLLVAYEAHTRFSGGCDASVNAIATLAAVKGEADASN